MSILDWTQRSESFDGIALYQGRRLTLTDSAGPQRLSGLRVSNGYFEIMQVTPYLRRFFGPAEFHEGGDAVVVLAYDFGKRHFQSDRSVVGKTIPLNYRSWT